MSVRELRNQGGKVIDRVQRGEQVIVTRDGEDVVELRATKAGLSAEALTARWKNLPRMDYESLHRDIDEVIDPDIWNVQ